MLTDKQFQEIEKAIGVSGLQELINSPEQQELTFTKTYHFPEKDYNILVENLKGSGNTKQSYEEGKVVQDEKNVKDLRKYFNLEFEGKTMDNLKKALEQKIELSKEGDITNLTNDYEKRLTALQKTVEEEKTKAEQLINKSKQEKINYLIDSKLNSLQIEVPDYIKDEKQAKQFVQLEREKNKLHFKQQYNFDLNNNTLIPTKDGEVIRDEVQNPITIDKLVDDYVKSNFIRVKTEIKGRGEGDRLPGKIASFKSIDQVLEYANSKGIKQNTPEFDTLMIEHQKNK